MVAFALSEATMACRWFKKFKYDSAVTVNATPILDRYLKRGLWNRKKRRCLMMLR